MHSARLARMHSRAALMTTAKEAKTKDVEEWENALLRHCAAFTSGRATDPKPATDLAAMLPEIPKPQTQWGHLVKSTRDSLLGLVKVVSGLLRVNQRVDDDQWLFYRWTVEGSIRLVRANTGQAEVEIRYMKQ